MLPVAPDAAEALFRVVDAAYEKRSIALTSNIHTAGFDELMPKTLAAATVDRLLHHAHVPLTDGTDTYRLARWGEPMVATGEKPDSRDPSLDSPVSGGVGGRWRAETSA